MNPIEQILSQQDIMILDGALATELEKRGCDLNDPLWSAKVLLERPELVAAVHEEYFSVGADCVITASYQATYEGLSARGLGDSEASALITGAVSIAKEVRDDFWNRGERTGRVRPLVAASVGPYGAYLADGSEYRGDYGLDEAQLVAFHRRRFATLIAAGADLLACETLPCLLEAKALVHLLEEHPGNYAWIAFTARDGRFTRNGELLADCAAWLDGHEQVAAIGINCTAPQYVAELIEEIRSNTDKPILVYPNSGELYDPVGKRWYAAGAHNFAELAVAWRKKGARVIGGCCRTGPDEIAAIRRGFIS